MAMKLYVTTPLIVFLYQWQKKNWLDFFKMWGDNPKNLRFWGYNSDCKFNLDNQPMDKVVGSVLFLFTQFFLCLVFWLLYYNPVLILGLVVFEVIRILVYSFAKYLEESDL